MPALEGRPPFAGDVLLAARILLLPQSYYCSRLLTLPQILEKVSRPARCFSSTHKLRWRHEALVLIGNWPVRVNE